MESVVGRREVRAEVEGGRAEVRGGRGRDAIISSEAWRASASL